MFKGLFDWCRAYFQHPVIPWFIFVGILFLALGLLDKLPLIGTGKTLLLGNKDMWMLSMVAGVLFIALAIFMMYKPPAGWRSRENPGIRTENVPVAPAEIPDAAHGAQQSFHARRMSLSDKQKIILSMIEQERKLPFHVIRTELGFENDSELYYRLEQIRLLGFVEKEKLRESASSTIWIYKLAKPYSTLLGNAKADETGFAVIT